MSKAKLSRGSIHLGFNRSHASSCDPRLRKVNDCDGQLLRYARIRRSNRGGPTIARKTGKHAKPVLGVVDLQPLEGVENPVGLDKSFRFRLDRAAVKSSSPHAF